MPTIETPDDFINTIQRLAATLNGQQEAMLSDIAYLGDQMSRANQVANRALDTIPKAERLAVLMAILSTRGSA